MNEEYQLNYTHDPYLQILYLKKTMLMQQKIYIFTTLKEACLKGDLYTVRQIIPLQLNVNTRDHLARLPIMYAAMGGNIEIIKYLIANNSIFITARDLERRTALWYAESNGHTDCVELLINNGAKITEKERKIAMQERAKQEIARSSLSTLAIQYFNHKKINQETVEQGKEMKNFRRLAIKYFKHLKKLQA